MFIAFILACETLMIDSCEMVQADQVYHELAKCESDIKLADEYLTEQGYYARGECTELYAKDKPDNENQI